MKNKRRYLQIAALIAVFGSVLIYECLTPVFSDDFSYMRDTAQARHAGEIFALEARQYLSWTGRSVSHLILRFFLYFFGLNRSVFNVAAALVFTLMTVLMTGLARGGRREDPLRMYLFISVCVWLFAVKPGQTIFWMTGACNYLFTTTIILTFFMLCRRTYAAPRGTVKPWQAVLLVLTGILAGWCNENTSGGAVLFALLYLVIPVIRQKRDGGILPPMMIRLAGLAGVSAGFLMQLLSPGNRYRVSVSGESQSGIAMYGVRFLGITEEVCSLFLPLLLAALFLIIAARRQGTSWADPGMKNALLFLLLSGATCGCLILAPSPQTRVYFGAGIFLLIACAQLFLLIRWDGVWPAAVRDFIIGALILVMAFRYVSYGGALAGIYREETARYALLEERRGQEDIDYYLPMLPARYDNRYTMAYEVDLQRKWNSFSNMQMAEYFGVTLIVGVPYEEYEDFVVPDDAGVKL
ncbi:MAG: hypothetical protein IKO80_07810 [Lachnospiraceae bacterium]|nr:hypothetical protein [Lachnospiraceae bacterium]